MLLVVETDLLNSGVLRLDAVTSKEQRKVDLLCNSPALFLLSQMQVARLNVPAIVFQLFADVSF